MSRSPNGMSEPVSSPTRACSRRPRGAPRVWIPTRASESSPGFFSTISWAIRTSVRRRSSRSMATTVREPPPKPATREILDAHRAAGRWFEAGGIRSFVRERGQSRGGTALLLHGVPTSSFLYRKVMPVLDDGGLREMAILLPGIGLADRPEDFDYSWSGLARWASHAVDALGLDTFHLVVHDIGGPVGFELAH